MEEEKAPIVKEADAVLDKVSEMEKLGSIKKETEARLEEQKKILESIETRKKEIEEVEAKVDKKTQDLKRLLIDAEISGRSLAGQTPQVETKEDKWKKEAKLRYAGTGMDPT